MLNLKMSGSRKLRSAQSSLRLFWSGVPVIRIRYRDGNLAHTETTVTICHQVPPPPFLMPPSIQIGRSIDPFMPQAS